MEGLWRGLPKGTSLRLQESEQKVMEKEVLGTLVNAQSTAHCIVFLLKRH